MRDLDNLTPLDARNSLLLDRKVSHQDSDTFSLAKTNLVAVKETSYQPLVHHAAPPGILHDQESGRASPVPVAGNYQAPARAGYDQRLGGGYNGDAYHSGYGHGHGY